MIRILWDSVCVPKEVRIHNYGLYANAHRGKVRKAGRSPFVLRMAEEDKKRIPSKGWAA
jgi:hypothetical protein